MAGFQVSISGRFWVSTEALKGLRSIRLSKGYRAYYKIVKDRVEFIRVERVDKHVY